MVLLQSGEVTVQGGFVFLTSMSRFRIQDVQVTNRKLFGEDVVADENLRGH